jgi:hypothetical protein
VANVLIFFTNSQKVTAEYDFMAINLQKASYTMTGYQPMLQRHAAIVTG